MLPERPDRLSAGLPQPDLMNIVTATRKYEAWLARQLPLLRTDLEFKHEQMGADRFAFFRATFYRWAQLWPAVCPELARAPRLLAVGDLHVENFGTWRDGEGRLAWGINDFDETYPMSYAVDLVRLAASAYIALAGAHLGLERQKASATILDGYVQGLKKGGEPIVLGEHHHWLRELAMSQLRDPQRFWAKLTALPTYRGPVPPGATKALERALPEPQLAYRVVHRLAGLGSLGRQRFTALADWRGGKVAREAKALAASAMVWSHGDSGSRRIRYEVILRRAVRCPDPFLHCRGRWIVRRLAPDCCRVELAELPEKHDAARLLWEMAWETANIHLASRKRIKDVRHHLSRQPQNWLHQAAAAMTQAVTRDWEEWRSR